jgi:hypothetical protein
LKSYGYKKNKKPRGDGCFLCTLERKGTKKSHRFAVKKEINKQLTTYNDEVYKRRRVSNGTSSDE